MCTVNNAAYDRRTLPHRKRPREGAALPYAIPLHLISGIRRIFIPWAAKDAVFLLDSGRPYEA